MEKQETKKGYQILFERINDSHKSVFMRVDGSITIEEAFELCCKKYFIGINHRLYNLKCGRFFAANDQKVSDLFDAFRLSKTKNDFILVWPNISLSKYYELYCFSEIYISYNNILFEISVFSKEESVKEILKEILETYHHKGYSISNSSKDIYALKDELAKLGELTVDNLAIYHKNIVLDRSDSLINQGVGEKAVLFLGIDLKKNK